MRFYFDIDEDYFNDEYGPEFKELIQGHAIQSIVDRINGSSFAYYHKEVSKLIDQIVKQHKDEIIETAVNRLRALLIVSSSTPKLFVIATAAIIFS